MEERRRSLWLLAAAALSFPAWACDPAIEGTRLESARYVLAYKAQKVSVAEHFALDVAACAKPGHPPPESLKVDAHMPEHLRLIANVTAAHLDRKRPYLPEDKFASQQRL